MARTFQMHDHVWVHDDEGLDVPETARGKYGVVVGFVRDDEDNVVEYIVSGKGFPIFNAASYHIVLVARLPESE